MIIILLILTANIAKYEHYVNYPSKFLTATQPQLLLETTKFQLFPMVLTMDMLVAWPLEPGNKRKRLQPLHTPDNLLFQASFF